MSDLRQAAQQALEALELTSEKRDPMRVAAITTLRAALAEPVQEPVATTQQRTEDTPPSDYRRGYWDGFAIGKREGRIEAEDAAKQAEPVAWMVYTQDGKSAYVTDNPTDLKDGQDAYALFPGPFERKPLTDEQIMEMYSEPRSDAEMIEFARAIERAHGIGG